jgi:hypothetical protein
LSFHENSKDGKDVEDARDADDEMGVMLIIVRLL